MEVNSTKNQYKTEKKRDSRLVAILATVFTLLFLAMGVGGVYYNGSKLYRHINLVFGGVKTEARITGYKESWSKDGDEINYTKMYSPVITYYDSSNHSYILHADYSSNSKEWSNDVTVYFDKKDPSKAIHSGFWHLWFGPFLFLCLYMIPLVIGLFVIIYYMGTLKKKKPFIT
ncbi:Protein of uncharacterised function (DUF3592) [Chryseobacterium nakagawai]|uniref:DUF3592 domain-containing protein n=1 Tax=Chryseobacterium nakagawai TaxID=1241982 RepID=A0AAD1DSV6_CHRNA|nr:DUF3592 domain-containing protein [Chryseobacterium nakagawai]AZA93216.1 DUF3592 domain-containing protein [Chryseobacterium nakagawai]VEH19873.1 Protein of uncharacterised function (DUF3592) [Chryseobacterium nakagawai]